MKKKTFRQLLSKVQTACSALRLQLSTSSRAMQQQIRRIIRAQQELEAIARDINALSIKERNSRVLKNYVLLGEVVQELVYEGSSLVLLAEEFSIDPEGTFFCLQSVNRRKLTLLKQLSDLEHSLLQRSLLHSLMSWWTVRGEPMLQLKRLEE